MDKHRFGSTSFNVSPLGFGAAPIGLLETKRERATRILREMLDAGVNVIDTAAMYRDSELVIGEAISDRREEYVLISKCGTPVEDIDAEPWSRELISRTVDRALRRLRTDHLDVMLLHTCDQATLARGEALAALVEARQQGKVKHAGYSGDNAALAYAAGMDEIEVLETSINLCDQQNIDLGVAAGRRRGLAVIAKRPVANAAWRDDLPGFYADYAADYKARFAKMNLTLEQLGFEGDPPEVWPQIALRFTMAFADTCVIGTTNPENAHRNVAAAEKGPLNEEQIRTIRSAFASARGDEDWPGLT